MHGEILGVYPQQLGEMLSWTGVQAGNVRMQFRGEIFVSRALRNPVMRGCVAVAISRRIHTGFQGKCRNPLNTMQ